jgi:hypothetical protein
MDFVQSAFIHKRPIRVAKSALALATYDILLVFVQ